MGLSSALKMTKFNVASINCCTEVEGPHKRLTVWFQGCNIHCKGCCNPDFQPIIPKHIMSLNQLIKIIEEARDKFGIEGVTYSGGEPTLQQNLPQLTDGIHNLGLGVISFTGRRFEDVKDILCGCDVVIDGAYIEEKRDTKRRILGSTNQRIICLTDRYPDCESWFADSSQKTIEVNIADFIVANGDVF